ncbi:ATP-binding protein [Nonomuraea monospora]|uniref:ATP-binding protein n=1 Tax=Nonomuraea monospora TaxID=568818 RepID=UPI0031D3D43F
MCRRACTWGPPSRPGWFRLRCSNDQAVQRLILVVTDDGIGMSEPGRRSGLRNIKERAVRLGGTTELESPDAGGTRLRWQIPL